MMMTSSIPKKICFDESSDVMPRIFPKCKRSKSGCFTLSMDKLMCIDRRVWSTRIMTGREHLISHPCIRMIGAALGKSLVSHW